MENREEEKLEKLTKRIMDDVNPESPSFEFENKVLSQLMEKNSNQSVYTPLISKKVWIAGAFIALAVVLILLLGDFTLTSGWFGSFTKEFESFKVTGDGLPYSNVIISAVILFAIMIVIQMSILKGFFNKRLSSGDS